MIKCGNCGIELAGGENSCFNCRYSQTWAKESASWKSWEMKDIKQDKKIF